MGQVYTNGLNGMRKSSKEKLFKNDLLIYNLIQWFHRLLRWDGCFTVTMAALGNISYLYIVLYCHQTITLS